MENREYGRSESVENIVAVYSDFMMRIAQFDELVSKGSHLLVSFHQALEVHTCHLGLQDYIRKAKVVIDELEFLVGNATSVMQTSKEKDEGISYNSDSCFNSNEQTPKEKDEDISCNLDLCTTIDQERPDVADYASIMAIIYSMVKQDYTMQLRIVSSLNHKSSHGELETYCQMWSLRPFVDDEISRKALNLVPGR